jgi:hypothetical protein
MEKYHLLDAELSYSQWSGDLPTDQKYQLQNLDSVKSQETIINLRYAYGLFRYTYFGINAGFTQSSVADFNHSEGPMDPDFIIGQHFPWDNGNFRLSINASPSFGKNTEIVTISDSGQTIKSNSLRGGFKIKPEAAIYFRLGKLIIGSEASYTYFGRRVIENQNQIDSTNFYNQSADYQYFSNSNYINNPNLNTNPNPNPNFNNNLSSIYSKDIYGGNILGFKLNLEVPNWQRLGVEWSFDQVQTRHIELSNQFSYDTNSFFQNKFKTYIRVKLNNQMSLIPEVTWIQPPPDEVLLTNNNQDIWLVGITLRSKFK